MKYQIVFTRCVFLLLIFVGAGPLLAQRFEIDPYASYFNADRFRRGEFKSEGIYGIKGGVFLNPSIEAELNFGYMNHFKLIGTNGRTRGLVWEALGAYNFGTRTIRGARFRPFVSIGVGGVTAAGGHAVSSATRQTIFLQDPFLGITRPFTSVTTTTLRSGDTFFAISYGGGVKALRLKGPLGVRAEIRGRTLPNFFGSTTSWIEGSGALTITWGEP